MEKRELEYGELLQLNPDCDAYGGEIVMVTKPKEWGCEGILFVRGEYPELIRYEGLAYVRVSFPNCEPVGKIKWKKELNDDESDN